MGLLWPGHVWLIFVFVVAWAAIPPVFAAVASTLYIPLTVAALGIIARGAAFAFRKASTQLWQQRLFGAAFAFSSFATPLFLGAAGSVGAGRVPPGIAAGDPIGSWVNATSAVSGALAVATGAYLAAVFLTRDAERENDRELAEAFRARAPRRMRCRDLRRCRISRAASGFAAAVPQSHARPGPTAHDRLGGGRAGVARLYHTFQREPARLPPGAPGRRQV
jgi:Cytochrome bd terminal oxidase subunit II